MCVSVGEGREQGVCECVCVRGGMLGVCVCVCVGEQGVCEGWDGGELCVCVCM